MKTIFKRARKALTAASCMAGNLRRVLTLAAIQILFGVTGAYAASDPFASATGEIKGYQDSVQSLLYAIAAVIALVGAFNVYHKMTNGDQDVKKTIMLTLGGCIAMVALSTALPAFFD